MLHKITNVEYYMQIKAFESKKVLPEELPESFWMALTFTLIVAMIGIIYTILQEIIQAQLPRK